MRKLPIRKCVYVVVVLAAIYVVSYYAMVEKGEILINPKAPVAEAFLTALSDMLLDFEH